MSSIEDNDIEMLVGKVDNITDSKFQENLISGDLSYYSDAIQYFDRRIQEYDFHEIGDLRDELNILWADTDKKKMIAPVLYLCEKLKDEEEQRFRGIDLVNYMM